MLASLSSCCHSVVIIIAACGVPQNNLRKQNKVGRSLQFLVGVS